MADDALLTMRDLADQQIRNADGRIVARVSTLEALWQEDGTLVLTHLRIGPQELAGRVWRRLFPIARFLLRDQFEHRVPMEEIDKMGLDIHLKADADRYGLGTADRWVVEHVLRFMPGSGR